ncbi:MAG: MlaD family protein [Prevotellamassilia sp.]|nr:MlaD family protein [Prevotellamassilia sp.]
MKKEIKIALTAIVALVLLFIGLNFLKGINVFKSTNTYYVKFKDVAGLAVSNPVYANGYPVGIVRTINYDYQRGENVVVAIELDDDMRVPAQTRAELETELMGGVKMLLVLGPNPAKNIEQGDTIQGGMHLGAMDKLNDMIPTVEKMLPKLDSIMDNLNRLTGDPALAATLHNAQAITNNLKESSIQLNSMMRNDLPPMLANLKSASANANRLTANLAAIDVQTTINSVNATLTSAHNLANQLGEMSTNLDRKLKSKDNTLGLFLNDTNVYDNLNSTLRNADSLMIDLKAHPKRYVHFSVFGKKEK